jgi:hypothetical protein
VAGLGNIYVCEVLFRAGISPLRLAGDRGAQVAGLVPLIREVLAEAIEAGGSSLRDYRQADGELGYFQHAFRVYGREGRPAKPPAAPAPSRASCNRGGPRSSAPPARDDLIPRRPARTTRRSQPWGLTAMAYETLIVEIEDYVALSG